MSIIPDGPNQPSRDFFAYRWLMYGQPKFGKTTFWSSLPGALYLATEPGTEALPVAAARITNYAEWEKAMQELATERCRKAYRVLIVDTADEMLRFANDAACASLKIQHPADLPMGKGWGRVTDFARAMLRQLAELPYGLIFIAHGEAKEEIHKTSRANHHQWVPTLSGKGGQAILNSMDFILFCDWMADKEGKDHRVIRTKPTVAYVAGDRFGTLPPTIEFGLDSLQRAFAYACEKRFGTAQAGQAPAPAQEPVDAGYEDVAELDAEAAEVPEV